MKSIYIVTYNMSYSYDNGEQRASSGVYGAYTERKAAEYAMLSAQYKIRENAATYICERIATVHINAISIDVKIVETNLE